MKHVDLFNDFLRDTVNLNTTRVGDLETSVEAIKSAVNSSDWTPNIRGWAGHGSWAHKTIIKPVDGGEFDADLLVLVREVEGWTPYDYIESLYNVFRVHGTYQDKVRRWSHCVTVTYANERKIDVAPCIVDREGITRYEVCNRNTDSFERTEPIKYTNWLIERNGYTGSNSFRKVTRLVKYLRDIKVTFTCPSVLLTTLLGNQVYSTDKYSTAFGDVPTALQTLFRRLDDWLQAYPEKPPVRNPFLASEDFADLWSDDAKYTNFRDFIHKYRGWIDDAYAETARGESIGKWRRVFGEDFATGVVIEEARSVSTNAARYITEQARIVSAFTGDLVAAVKSFGGRALPPGFDSMPHMRRPKWRVASGVGISVLVRADLYTSRNSSMPIGPVASLEPLAAGDWLRFRALNSQNGATFSTNDFDVQWRVTNTDEVAFRARALRGEFYNSDTGHARWERLEYRGVHLVEAFLIRRRDDALVGRSSPFRVVIE